MESGKIGIYEYQDGSADVQVKFGDIYFEFGASNVKEAQELIETLKNSVVAVNPDNSFWDTK